MKSVWNLIGTIHNGFKHQSNSMEHFQMNKIAWAFSCEYFKIDLNNVVEMALNPNNGQACTCVYVCDCSRVLLASAFTSNKTSISYTYTPYVRIAMANALVFHNFDNMILLNIHKMASVTDVNRFKDVKIERDKKRITEEKKNNDIFSEIFQTDSNI